MGLIRNRRRRNHEVAELNITAFMNLMVVLVPFLLITAVFSQVSILDLDLPTDGAEPAEAEAPELRLEITIREDRIDVGDRGTGLLTVIGNTPRGYDLDGLGRYLEGLKRRFPDKSDATLLLEPDISYQTLVAVMDKVRVLERLDAAGTGVVSYELFPEISIGDAPSSP